MFYVLHLYYTYQLADRFFFVYSLSEQPLGYGGEGSPTTLSRSSITKRPKCHQEECRSPSGKLTIPDSKVHGANMGPIWGRQDPGGPHVGPMNLAIWDAGAADGIAQ